MRTKHALGLAFASTVALMSTLASADVAADVKQTPQSAAAQVIMAGSGAKRGRIDGEMKLRYPGFEQTAVAFQKNHIVLITMEAVQEKGKGPVQCSCSSYELQKDGPPRAVVELKRLTEYSNGERTCNHPAAASDGENIVWMYGSDYNNNRPNTYAGILNEKCETLSAPIMVNALDPNGQSRNANDGAPDVVAVAPGKFIGSYYSDGGDVTGPFPAAGGDYSVAMALDVIGGGTLPTLQRGWVMPMVSPTQIGRPTLAPVAADRALLCAGKGPNRPTDHIECNLFDTNTGASVWKQEIVRARPGGQGQQRNYYNQPTIKKISDNQYALLAIESNGMGKNTNIKGANTAHLYMLNRAGDSITMGTEIVGASAHQTHASICVGPYGEQGAPTVAVFSAAPTGIGRAAMAMVGYDQGAAAFRYDPKADLWPAAWYGDSGHLANWYGRNPMRQGRDFMRCIGGVENPGYHQPNGYMADVKTFFVGAVHGRIPGDEKNSLFLSLVPGQMDKKPLPQNPVPAGEKPSTDTDLTNKDNNPQGDSGCACSTPGANGLNPNTAALVGVVALGLVISLRRRRR